MKQIIRGVFFGLAFFASGCVSLLPETSPPKPRYHISAVKADALAGASVDWSLVVEDPHTTRVYDTTRIAVSTAPGKIQYFAGAEWADRAPRLFQTALVQSLEDSGRIITVGDRSAIPIADYVLQTDLRAIQLNIRGGRVASVSIYARLTDGKGKIYAAKLFEMSASATSDRADDVVAAFDSAFASAITGIVNWALEEGEASAATQG
jgi:cholesterol transport system auxiliary component